MVRDFLPEKMQRSDGEKHNPSLTEKVVKGVGWVSVGAFATRSLAFIRLIVLARLLAPEDFGLFGVVLLTTSAIGTFTQTGFTAALIQRKDDTQLYLDAAWTVQVIRAFCIALVLFVTAPVAAWFFSEPRVISLIRVISIGHLISGFSNIGIIYFRKELNFKRQIVYDICLAVIPFFIGIFLAYCLRNVWALVWVALAESALGCLLSYLLHDYRPRFNFEKTKIAELFGYGRWLLGSSVVIFLATHGDDAFLGKMLGVGALGFYQIAYRISNIPATGITHLTSSIMMPAYAAVQCEKDRLARGFKNTLEMILTVTIPLTVFIMLSAPEIVYGVLGAKWTPAIKPIQILAVAGFIRAVAATGGPLFLGTGRPEMDFWMNLCRVMVIAITIYPLTKMYGVSGTSFSIVIGLAATIPLWLKVKYLTGLSWGDIVGCFKGGTLTGGVMLAGLYGGKRFFTEVGPPQLLVIEIAISLVLFLIMMWIFWRYSQSELLAKVTQELKIVLSK